MTDDERKAIRQTIKTLAEEADELRMMIGDTYPIILNDKTAADDFAEEHYHNG